MPLSQPNRCFQLGDAIGWEVAMGTEIGLSKQSQTLPDVELLRRIAQDMRALYADVIKQPLPRNIVVALSRIDREQSRAVYQAQRLEV
jgi:hypothetical protein